MVHSPYSEAMSGSVGGNLFGTGFSTMNERV